MRKSVARLIAALLVVVPLAACHSIERGVYAHAPVPLSVLPLREPVTYTVGPNAGRFVPTQHGLLASYFNGADYVQPAYNEYLDHQQIDPNVDFIWDGSNTNPVIPAGHGGIDVSEGDPFLPDHWPIWSVVWEGYLEAPTSGDYRLNLHVNNGGWLEMKDASGALQTIISCPGGSSFEGDCLATTTLSAGRQYIRISYYNNAPSSANAIFSWQKPGDTALSVVPMEALWTQGARAAERGYIFVHGIRGNHRDTRSFGSVLGPLDQLSDDRLLRFRYFQDVGDTDSGTCRSREPLMPSSSGGLPLDLSDHSLDMSICDSQSNVGLNAVWLDQDVRDMHSRLHGKITLIANSMGGAIVRAFLAYAVETRSVALEAVDEVIFLQGAQAGSYLAYSRPAAALLVESRFGPVLGPIVFRGAEEAIRSSTGWDATRPAIDDLTPVASGTYRFANPNAAHVPEGVGFINVASEIHLGLDVGLFGYRLQTRGVPLGDYVILPGSDDPTALPVLGGARFDPAVIGRKADHAQYLLERDLTIKFEALVQRTPTATGIKIDFAFPQDLLDIPQSHLQLGAVPTDPSKPPRMHEISVIDRHTGTAAWLDDVLISEIARQGQ